MKHNKQKNMHYICNECKMNCGHIGPGIPKKTVDNDCKPVWHNITYIVKRNWKDDAGFYKQGNNDRMLKRLRSLNSDLMFRAFFILKRDLKEELEQITGNPVKYNELKEKLIHLIKAEEDLMTYMVKDTVAFYRNWDRWEPDSEEYQEDGIKTIIDEFKSTQKKFRQCWEDKHAKSI